MTGKTLLLILTLSATLAANVFDLEQTYFDEEINKETKKDYAIPPPKHPYDEASMIFFVHASYTLWSPYQQNMILLYSGYTESGTPQNWITTSISPQSGFKAGISCNTFHDGWRANAQYTWFNNNTGYISPYLNNYISYYSIWSDIVDLKVGQLESQWNNTFQRVDVTCDRIFYIGNYLTFKPWIGILGAWDHQVFNQKIAPKTLPDDFETINQTMNWWGLGPYGGFLSSYYFVESFALEYLIGGSLNFVSQRTKNINTRENYTPRVRTNTKSLIYDLQPMLETMLGFKWESFGKDWGLTIAAGWELQVWFSHSSFINAYQDSFYAFYNNYGNYSTQGLTTTATINF